MERRRIAPVSTANQLVASNLRRARRMRGLTQEQAAELLEPYLGTRWSKASFSAAETSVEGKRIREFSGNEILAFARVFDVPVGWFFLPVEELLPEVPVDVVCGGPERVNVGALLDAVMPFGPKPELTERLQEIAERVPAGLRGELEDRTFRYVAARAGAALAATLDPINQHAQDLRDLADTLEAAGKVARSQIAEELDAVAQHREEVRA